jgi:hypothetical protein
MSVWKREDICQYVWRHSFVPSRAPVARDMDEYRDAVVILDDPHFMGTMTSALKMLDTMSKDLKVRYFPLAMMCHRASWPLVYMDYLRHEARFLLPLDHWFDDTDQIDELRWEDQPTVLCPTVSNRLLKFDKVIDLLQGRGPKLEPTLSDPASDSSQLGPAGKYVAQVWHTDWTFEFDGRDLTQEGYGFETIDGILVNNQLLHFTMDQAEQEVHPLSDRYDGEDNADDIIAQSDNEQNWQEILADDFVRVDKPQTLTPHKDDEPYTWRPWSKVWMKGKDHTLKIECRAASCSTCPHNDPECVDKLGVALCKESPLWTSRWFDKVTMGIHEPKPPVVAAPENGGLRIYGKTHPEYAAKAKEIGLI